MADLIRPISWLKAAQKDFAEFPLDVQIDMTTALGGVTMSDDDFELVRGSGNVFRDMGYPNADILQAKAMLGAKIIGVLDDQHISVRRAHELTGFAAADFSRVRQAKLQRFTLERLISMLVKLNQDVEISIEVKPRAHGHLAPA
jgi:predicted XRE-type DNA-binding protein